MTRKNDTVNNPPETSLTEAQVMAFLAANPSFLSEHAELVDKMETPTRYDNERVVDLQHFMVEKLKQELEQMRGCAEHLITTSKNNMTIQSRTHEAALAALAARNMGGLAYAVSTDFPSFLDVDMVELGFEAGSSGQPMIAGVKCLPAGRVEMLLGDGDVMLRSGSEADSLLFGARPREIKSFALVRLDTDIAPPGVLAIGSRNDRAFHQSQGTELLAFLGEVIKDCVRRWWEKG